MKHSEIGGSDSPPCRLTNLRGRLKNLGDLFRGLSGRYKLFSYRDHEDTQCLWLQKTKILLFWWGGGGGVMLPKRGIVECWSLYLGPLFAEPLMQNFVGKTQRQEIKPKSSNARGKCTARGILKI